MKFRIIRKEFDDNVILNGLVIVLMIVIFVITIYVTASMKNSLGKFYAVKEWLDSEGYYYGTMVLTNPNNRELLRDKEGIKEFVGENVEVTAQYKLPGAFLNGYEANIWAYDWNIIENYKPMLSSGRWFTQKDIQNRKQLYGVILDTGAYKVGDKVTITNWDKECPVEVEIIRR